MEAIKTLILTEEDVSNLIGMEAKKAIEYLTYVIEFSLPEHLRKSLELL